MPDLNAPRYAIPCLDAQGQLTGRTLVCPDRKRIATTECSTFEACPLCYGPTPEAFRVTFTGIQLCRCDPDPYGGHSTWEILSGQVNDLPIRVPWHSFYGWNCAWYDGATFALLRQTVYGNQCQAVIETQLWSATARVMLHVWGGTSTWWVDLFMERGDIHTFMFGGGRTLPPGDCSSFPITVYNGDACEFGSAGEGGNALVEIL